MSVLVVVPAQEFDNDVVGLVDKVVANPNDGAAVARALRVIGDRLGEQAYGIRVKGSSLANVVSHYNQVQLGNNTQSVRFLSDQLARVQIAVAAAQVAAAEAERAERLAAALAIVAS